MNPCVFFAFSHLEDQPDLLFLRPLILAQPEIQGQPFTIQIFLHYPSPLQIFSTLSSQHFI